MVFLLLHTLEKSFLMYSLLIVILVPTFYHKLHLTHFFKLNKLEHTHLADLQPYKYHTGYFTSDDGPDGIEGATRGAFAKQTWMWT
jgi:hypothetical protein